MNSFGLTGEMGCGKSLVAGLLDRRRDTTVLNSDMIAKQFLVDRRQRRQVEQALGITLSGDDPADFAAVAELIFRDPNAKRRLEEVLHPLVWDTVQQSLARTAAGTIHVTESALLYEIDWQRRFDGVILVVCDPTEQRRRLREIRGLSEAEIDGRLASQLPVAIKEASAWAILSTDCSLEEVAARTTQLHQRLVGAVSAAA